jgi:hypothetical protein
MLRDADAKIQLPEVLGGRATLDAPTTWRAARVFG